MCPDNVPLKVIELLQCDNLVFLATVMQDGSPQVTPVWAHYENQHLFVNTAEGRVKHKNILRDPRVGISVVSKNNPLDMTSIRGTVVEIIPDYDYKYADKLTKKYLNKEKYPFCKENEKRITIKIKPQTIFILPELKMNLD